MLKAREAFQYGSGEERSTVSLKTKFEEYCSAPTIPFEQNPFFTCVERAGLCPDGFRAVFFNPGPRATLPCMF